MIYHKIDKETGTFTEDVILNEPPMVLNWPVTEEGTPIQPEVSEGEEVPPMYVPDPSYIETPCPDGFFWPRWDGAQWVEGKTPEEIAAIKEVAQPPTPAEQWRTDMENALMELAGMIAGGM